MTNSRATRTVGPRVVSERSQGRQKHQLAINPRHYRPSESSFEAHAPPLQTTRHKLARASAFTGHVPPAAPGNLCRKTIRVPPDPDHAPRAAPQNIYLDLQTGVGLFFCARSLARRERSLHLARPRVSISTDYHSFDSFVICFCSSSPFVKVCCFPRRIY